ncbi:MAG: hypothetical protein M1338_02780 [Patescibacteria group bacterium]|nr:hypothetical protein [Patescibacteria group bacterium]
MNNSDGTKIICDSPDHTKCTAFALACTAFPGKYSMDIEKCPFLRDNEFCINGLKAKEIDKVLDRSATRELIVHSAKIERLADFPNKANNIKDILGRRGLL